MQRKIIELGKGCMVVSLPAKWVQEHQLQKGQDIEVADVEGILNIRALGKPKEHSGTLDVSDAGVLARRSTAAMYKAGYDEVIVTFKDVAELERVEQSLKNESVSFEIVQQSKNQCTLRSISEANAEEFDALLRRTLLLLKTMGADLCNAWIEGDIAAMQGVKRLEQTNNRLTHHLRRFLNREGFPERRKTTMMYVIAEMLEKVADYYEYLSNILSDPAYKDLKKSEQSVALFQKVNASVALFCDLFYNYKKEKVAELAALRKEIVAGAEEMLLKKPSKEYILVCHLLTIEQGIFDMIWPYLTLIS
ncbi:hypothetical protein HZB01_02300 [Candidatus Woesearchaeota archaeon]|nr:hypothetical protein [Candidatus Woesearchaeota archaeon]